MRHKLFAGGYRIIELLAKKKGLAVNLKIDIVSDVV